MAEAGFHECPAPGCTVEVPYRQLACRGHWFALPREIRDRVNLAWRHRGVDPREHRAAMRDAIDYLEARYGGAEEVPQS